LVGIDRRVPLFDRPIGKLQSDIVTPTEPRGIAVEREVGEGTAAAVGDRLGGLTSDHGRPGDRPVKLIDSRLGVRIESSVAAEAERGRAAVALVERDGCAVSKPQFDAIVGFVVDRERITVEIEPWFERLRLHVLFVVGLSIRSVVGRGVVVIEFRLGAVDSVAIVAGCGFGGVIAVVGLLCGDCLGGEPRCSSPQ